MIEGAGDVDMEPCPIATSAKDSSGAPSPVRLAVDAATCMDDGSSCAVSAYDIVATPGRTTPAMGAPDAPSSSCSLVDAAIGCASLVDVVATPTPLMLTTGVALASSWCIC